MSNLKKRVLIADDDKQLVDVLSRRCQSLGLEVIEAYDALSAINLVYTCTPDVLCLDVNMPAGGGLSACEMLSNDEKHSSMPIIILTGEKDEETIRRCHARCAYYVEKGSDVWSRVEPLLVDLLQIPSPGKRETHTSSDGVESQITSCDGPSVHDPLVDAVFTALGVDSDYLDKEAPRQESSVEPIDRNSLPWVLHIDDDREIREIVKMRLQKHGISVVNAFDGTSGVRTAMTHPASAIILDYEMPNGLGDYVLRRLKTNPVTQNIPVLILTGVKDKFLERRLLAMGAACFANKPPDFDMLIGELQKYVELTANELVTA